MHCPSGVQVVASGARCTNGGGTLSTETAKVGLGQRSQRSVDNSASVHLQQEVVGLQISNYVQGITQTAVHRG